MDCKVFELSSFFPLYMWSRKMTLNSENAEMEVNGKDDLKEPLLKALDGVAVDIPQQINDSGKKFRTVKFKVREIKCASCATSIESVLVNLTGVESAMVSPLEGQAEVKYVPELVTVSCLTAHRLGFSICLISFFFFLLFMSVFVVTN